MIQLVCATVLFAIGAAILRYPAFARKTGAVSAGFAGPAGMARIGLALFAIGMALASLALRGGVDPTLYWRVPVCIVVGCVIAWMFNEALGEWIEGVVSLFGVALLLVLSFTT